MYLSLSILLEALNGLEIEKHNVSGTKKFRGVRLVRGSESVLDPDFLHVCPLSMALRLNAGNPECVFVALRDRFRREDEENCVLNTVVVNDDVTVVNIYIALEERVNMMFSWQEDMQRIIIEERPLGDMLIASEGILKNFISVSDSTLSLIAYTPNIPIDDPVTCRLISKGYHDDETVELFKKNNRFQKWQEVEGILFDSEHITSPDYQVVSRVFRYIGSYYTHVVMVCNRESVNDALIDKFNIFTDNMAVYLKKNNEKSRQRGGTDSCYIIERLLDSSEISTELVTESMSKLRLDGQKRFWLLSLSHEFSGSAPSGIVSHEVQNSLPKAKVAVYRDSLLVLVSSTEESEYVLQKSLEQVLPTLNEKKFVCSVSGGFCSLEEIKNAYQQATLAMNYGKRLINVSQRPEFCGPIFRYEDFYVHIMLCESNNSTFMHESRWYKILCDIRDADKNRGTNNYRLLYCYLTERCHAGNTAQRMYMSRNNIVYRIDNLVEKYGLDLNDYLVRMGLLVTFEIMRLDRSN